MEFSAKVIEIINRAAPYCYRSIVFMPHDMETRLLWATYTGIKDLWVSNSALKSFETFETLSIGIPPSILAKLNFNSSLLMYSASQQFQRLVEEYPQNTRVLERFASHEMTSMIHVDSYLPALKVAKRKLQHALSAKSMLLQLVKLDSSKIPIAASMAASMGMELLVEEYAVPDVCNIKLRFKTANLGQ